MILAPLIIQIASETYKGISKHIQEQKQYLGSDISIANTDYIYYEDQDGDGNYTADNRQTLHIGYIRGSFSNKGGAKCDDSGDGSLSCKEYNKTWKDYASIDGYIHQLFQFEASIVNGTIELRPSLVVYNFPAAIKKEDNKKSVTITLNFKVVGLQKDGTLKDSTFAVFQMTKDDLEMGTILTADNLKNQLLGVFPLPSANASSPKQTLRVPFTLEVRVQESEEPSFFTNVLGEAMKGSEEAMLKNIQELINTFLGVKKEAQAEAAK